MVELVKLHRHYLCDQKFTVQIDHSPILSVLKTKEPEGELATRAVKRLFKWEGG